MPDPQDEVQIVDSLILLHLVDGRTLRLDLHDGAWATLITYGLVDDRGKSSTWHGLTLRFPEGRSEVSIHAPVREVVLPVDFQNPFQESGE